jgi:peptidoglycan/LPS O-acetylase OafA/YrhL
MGRAGDARDTGPRRWLGAGVLLILIGGIVLVVPRIAPRSPLTIVVLCALAILTMKLVERRLRQWLTAWAARQTAAAPRPKVRRRDTGGKRAP